jgi:hypothetical protein
MTWTPMLGPFQRFIHSLEWPQDSETELRFAFIVIVDFEQHAAALRFERAVMNPGRPARISRSLKRFAASTICIVADDQVA